MCAGACRVGSLCCRYATRPFVFCFFQAEGGIRDLTVTGVQTCALPICAKIKLSKPKTAFLFDGDDRVGALADTMAKLGAAKINVTAVSAVCAGMGRYGAILWVKPRDVNKAAAALGAM